MSNELIVTVEENKFVLEIETTVDNTANKIDIDFKNHDVVEISTSNPVSGGGGSTLTQEQVQDYVAGLLTGTSGISADYQDITNNLSISVTGINSNQINNFNSAVDARVTVASISAEEIMDVVGGVSGIYGVSGISVNYKDTDDRLDIGINEITESQIVDLQSYLTSFTETNNLSSAVTWADVPDGNITNSSVTQHSGSLQITESQVVDLQNYLTSHPIISNAASDSDNSGSTFIQDILVDSYGHVTGIGTGVATGGGSEINDLSSSVTWASVPDLYITESSVTQHSGALRITESQVVDLQPYLTSESNNLSSAVTWTNVPDINITQSSVVQHSGALLITESQITDLQSYLTSYTETDTLANVTSRGNTTTTTCVIPFYYGNQAAFPNATTYHGAIAHSHSDGAMYFAHGGVWHKLANDSDIDNSANWDTAYTTVNNSGNAWTQAYNWGDHGSQGYLTDHPSISAASSSDNSPRTYIQDILLDSNGHVTGIAVATETVTDTDTTYTAGSGLFLDSSNEFHANVSGIQSITSNSTTSTAGRSYSVQIDSNDRLVVNVPWVDTGTTYTAGSGLQLNGTTFDSLTATVSSSGITTLSNTINTDQDKALTPKSINDAVSDGTIHPNISPSASTSNTNSGNTFLQNIAFDTNGHVTSVSVGTASEGDGGGGLSSVLADDSPQLGGDLDLNSFAVSGQGSVDINGSGIFSLNVVATGMGIGIEQPNTVGNEAGLHIADRNYPELHFTNDTTGHSNTDGAHIQLNGTTLNTINRKSNSYIQFHTFDASSVTKQRLGLGPTQSVFNASYDNNDFLVYGTGTTPVIHVDAFNERLGIGTSSPTEKLDIRDGDILVGTKLLVGSGVYSASSPGAYFGLKHTELTGPSEFMIMSAGSHTYLSAKEDSDVYIRGGGNKADHQIVVTESGITLGKNRPSASSVDAEHDVELVYDDGGCVRIADRDGSGIMIGDCAYSASEQYAGMKHTNHTDAQEYMIISAGHSTVVSSKAGTSTYIRAGGNDTTYQGIFGTSSFGIGTSGNRLRVNSQSVLVNNGTGNYDFKVYAQDEAVPLIHADAATNKLGIGTETPSYQLDVVGTGRFVHTDGHCGLIIEDAGGSGLHLGDCAGHGAGGTYTGMKHSNHSSADEYMILSDGTSTFIGGKTSSTTYLRSGGNGQTYQAQIASSYFGVGTSDGNRLKIDNNTSIFNKDTGNYDFKVMPYNNENPIIYCDADGGSDGRLGVGTDSPQTKLDVSGTITASGLALASGATAYANIGLTAGDLHISLDDTNTESDADRIQFNIDGTEILSMTSPDGLDTTFLAQQVDINTNGINRNIFGYGSNWFNVNNNDIDFRIDGDSDYTLFVKSSADSVGIGTNTPQTTLDVSGIITGTSFVKDGGTSSQFLKADGSVSDAFYVEGIGNNTTDIATWTNVTSSTAKSIGSSLGTRFVINNGMMGVGTANPSHLLSVSGSINATTIIKQGGTSSDFLKADGTVDSNTYLTSSTETTYSPGSGLALGGTTFNALTATTSTSGITTLSNTINTDEDKALTPKAVNDAGYISSVSNIDTTNFNASTIVTESEGISSNDNDTTLPTSAAVKDYVDNNAGTTYTAGSGLVLNGTTFDARTATTSVSGITTLSNTINSDEDKALTPKAVNDAGYVDGDGTASYISKWSDSNTLTDSVIYDDGTNIGLGAANPAALFHVRKDSTYNSENTYAIKISDGNDPETHGLLLGADATNNISPIQAVDPGTSWARNLSLQALGGNVGIGTISPSKKLHVVGDLLIDDGSAIVFDSNGLKITDDTVGATLDTNIDDALVIGEGSKSYADKSINIANGRFSSDGDSQKILQVLRGSTTNTNLFYLSNTGSTASLLMNSSDLAIPGTAFNVDGILLPSSAVFTFTIHVSCRKQGSDDSAAWIIRGAVRNSKGWADGDVGAIVGASNISSTMNYHLIGSPIVESYIDPALAGVTAEVTTSYYNPSSTNTINNAWFGIQTNGLSSTNLRWSATVEGVLTTY